MWFQGCKMSHKEMLALCVIIFSTCMKLLKIWDSFLFWNFSGDFTDRPAFSTVCSMQVFTSMEDMFATHFLITFGRMNLRTCFNKNLIFFVVLIYEKKIFLDIQCIARGQQKALIPTDLRSKRYCKFVTSLPSSSICFPCLSQ